MKYMISNIILESNHLLPLKINRAIFNKWVEKRLKYQWEYLTQRARDSTDPQTFNWKPPEEVSHLHRVETSCLKMWRPWIPNMQCIHSIEMYSLYEKSRFQSKASIWLCKFCKLQRTELGCKYTTTNRWRWLKRRRLVQSNEGFGWRRWICFGYEEVLEQR